MISEEIIRHSLETMAISAITSPKTKGDDSIGCRLILGGDIKILGEQMIEYGEISGRKNFDRDGSNIINCNGVLILYIKKPYGVGLNCGACGCKSCSELTTRKGNEFEGPVCVFRTTDLGISLGSAVKTASLLNLDNRIFYRVGSVAIKYKWVDSVFALGIGISVSNKNIFFDR